MNVSIRNNSEKYKDVVVEIDNTKIEVGLLDKKEATELAKDLIYAAGELLYWKD